MADTELKIKISADTSSAETGIDNVSKKTTAAADNATASAVAWQSAGQAMLSLGGKLSSSTNSMASSYMNFDQAMTDAETVISGNADDMAKLREQAVELSKTMPASAQQIAEGYYTLGRGGVEASKILEMTPKYLEAATASGSDFGTVAGATGTVMKIWGLEASKMDATLNTLYNTSMVSKTSMEDLKGAYATVGQQASTLGISFEELSLLFATAKKGGVDVSTAATGLRMAFMNMASPTADAIANMEKYGIEIVKNADGSVNMQATLDSVKTAMDGVSSGTERLSVLESIFGARSAGTIIALTNQSDAMGDLAGKLDATGTMQDAYSQKMEGSGNKMKVMQNQMTAARMEMGGSMLPAQLACTNATVKMYEAFNSLPGPMRDSLAVGGMLLSQVAAMIAPYMMMIPLLKTINFERAKDNILSGIQAAKNGILAASQWVVNASMYGCPLVWILAAIIAVVAVIVLLALNWDKVTKAVGKFGADAQKWLGSASDATKEWAGDTQASMDKSWASFAGYCDDAKARGDELGNELKQSAINTMVAVKDGLAEGWTNTWTFFSDMFTQIDEAFTKLVDDALEWGKNLADSFRKGVESGVDNIKKAVKDVGKKVKDYLGISSPAKEGPLKDIEKWPRNLTKTYAEGISSGAGQIGKSAMGMAGKLAGNNYDQRAYSLQSSFNILSQPLNLNDPYIQRLLADTISGEIKKKLLVG